MTNSPLTFVNRFMHNVVKWPNILLKSYGVHNARFSNYVWSFYNITHERVKMLYSQQFYFDISLISHRLQYKYQDYNILDAIYYNKLFFSS